MKLVTFQSYDFVCSLFMNSLAKATDAPTDLASSQAYSWVAEKLSEKCRDRQRCIIPILAWASCNKSICPPKRKGHSDTHYDAKIVFNKDDSEVLTFDHRGLSCVINNQYIPASISDLEKFNRLCVRNGVTYDDLRALARDDANFFEVCKRVYSSFDRCITDKAQFLRAALWSFSIDEVESIELLHNDSYTYGELSKKRNFVQELYDSIPFCPVPVDPVIRATV